MIKTFIETYEKAQENKLDYFRNLQVTKILQNSSDNSKLLITNEVLRLVGRQNQQFIKMFCWLLKFA